MSVPVHSMLNPTAASPMRPTIDTVKFCFEASNPTQTNVGQQGQQQAGPLMSAASLAAVSATVLTRWGAFADARERVPLNPTWHIDNVIEDMRANYRHQQAALSGQPTIATTSAQQFRKIGTSPIHQVSPLYHSMVGELNYQFGNANPEFINLRSELMSDDNIVDVMTFYSEDYDEFIESVTPELYNYGINSHEILFRAFMTAVNLVRENNDLAGERVVINVKHPKYFLEKENFAELYNGALVMIYYYGLVFGLYAVSDVEVKVEEKLAFRKCVYIVHYIYMWAALDRNCNNNLSILRAVYYFVVEINFMYFHINSLLDHLNEVCKRDQAFLQYWRNL
ncbi:hypothetical protein H4219_005137 [Mycoemilia scoparia]|uniref:Uncharacterized protein n=1 Tax=Mycoemilia scoparia TaxID=417184 RepID=A0A9W8DQ44_9FUNG|nr:hypothetical protein H4219_005137 [Mycoemilia scoparia]